MMPVMTFTAVCVIFFFKQKTASEMRISDWSSDVCSSDLQAAGGTLAVVLGHQRVGHVASVGTGACQWCQKDAVGQGERTRSEEHTSELQSLMRISYAVFCLKKKKNKETNNIKTITSNNLTTTHHKSLHLLYRTYTHK